MNNVAYELQFGFQQKCSTFHPLINLTDKITERPDSENSG